MGVLLSDLINPGLEAKLRAAVGDDGPPAGSTAGPGDPVVEETGPAREFKDGLEDASSTTLEHKSDAAVAQVLEADDNTGRVVALVSVTGVEDRVRDVIEPGAYTKTLAQREPIGVWSHDDKTWVARTESARELMPGDPFLRDLKTMDGKPWDAKAGAVLVEALFNLETPHGAAAYSDVKFFKGKTGWSIGYKATKAVRNLRTGVRHIKELDWFEYSPVMVGAASQPMTLSVKSLAQPVDANDPTGLFEELVDTLEPAELKRYVELKESLGLEVKDRVRTPEGQRRFGQPIGSVIVPDTLNKLNAGDLKVGMEVDFQGGAPGAGAKPVKGAITKVDRSGGHTTVTVGGESHKLRDSSPVTVTKGMPDDVPLRDIDLAQMIKAAMAKGDNDEVALIRKVAALPPEKRRAALTGKQDDAPAAGGKKPDGPAPAGKDREATVRTIEAAPISREDREDALEAVKKGDFGKAADIVEGSGSKGAAAAIRERHGVSKGGTADSGASKPAPKGEDRESLLKKAKADDEADVTIEGPDDSVTEIPPVSVLAKQLSEEFDSVDDLPGDSDEGPQAYHLLESFDFAHDGDDDQAMDLLLSRIEKAVDKAFSDERDENGDSIRDAQGRLPSERPARDAGTSKAGKRVRPSPSMEQREAASRSGTSAESPAAKAQREAYDKMAGGLPVDVLKQAIADNRKAGLPDTHPLQKAMLAALARKEKKADPDDLEHKRSSASLDRSPRSNWVEQNGDLPAYVREVARAIHEDHGTPLDRAIPMAIGRIKKWAAGVGNVNADTRAKAAKAVAEWEALKAKARAKFDSSLLIDMEQKGYLAELEESWAAELDEALTEVKAEHDAGQELATDFAAVLAAGREFKAGLGLAAVDDAASGDLSDVLARRAALGTVVPPFELKRDSHRDGGSGATPAAAARAADARKPYKPKPTPKAAAKPAAPAAASGSGKTARIVRTQAGAQRYGVQIGQPYTAGQKPQGDPKGKDRPRRPIDDDDRPDLKPEGSEPKRGEEGKTTQAMQEMLVKLGLLEPREDGSVHGKFGPRTEEAVREFQSRNGMKVTGQLTADTMAALKKETPAGDPKGDGKTGSSGGSGSGKQEVAPTPAPQRNGQQPAGPPPKPVVKDMSDDTVRPGDRPDPEAEKQGIRDWFKTLPPETQKRVLRRARALMEATSTART